MQARRSFPWTAADRRAVGETVTMTSRAWRPDPAVAAVAVSLVALNALKRVTIDDTVFLTYARHIAARPTDPYGFEIFWYDLPTPAMDLLVPPVLPYWLGAGIALFGEHPMVLKLWLLPFGWLLAWGVRELIAEFAPSGGLPLLVICTLGPTIAPAFNLMLDVPALALGVGALALFLHACRSRDARIAIVAGLIAGLAIQTKYNAVASALALVVLGLTRRRLRATALAAGTAAVVALGWEAWLVVRYGESHVLHHLLAPAQSAWAYSRTAWAVSWESLFGALGAPVALLALTTLSRSPIVLAMGIVGASIPYAIIAALEPRAVPAPIRPIRLGAGDVALDAFFAVGCLAITVVLGAVAVGLRRRGVGRGSAFLITWLALELLVCFAMSPFPAARRVIAPILVATLFVAHLGLDARRARAGLRAVAISTAVLGALFAIADIADAEARYRAHEQVVRRLARLGHDPGRERVWFLGHWGFQYYAERAGYAPLVAGRSVLQRGDFIVAPQDVSVQWLPRIEVGRPLARIATSSPFPFSTNPSFYQGAVPIRRQPSVALRVRIHRALASGRVPPPPEAEASRGSLLRRGARRATSGGHRSPQEGR